MIKLGIFRHDSANILLYPANILLISYYSLMGIWPQYIISEDLRCVLDAHFFNFPGVPPSTPRNGA